MELKGAVLIIGSLLWDNADRRRWRDARLDLARQQRVWAPIRYGRLSDSRSKTHTMVVSRLCYRHTRLGTGWIVPFSHPIRSPDDLIVEARCLASAEGLRAAEWDWGAIGILTKPRVGGIKEIKSEWAKYFTSRTKKCKVFHRHAPSEGPAVSRRGVLALKWPKLVKTEKPLANVDIIFATPTAAHLDKKKYPRPREIGETYVERRNPEYFLKNVCAGIRTAHDPAIWKSMCRQNPGLVTRHPDIDSLLQSKKL